MILHTWFDLRFLVASTPAESLNELREDIDDYHDWMGYDHGDMIFCRWIKDEHLSICLN